jgi:serine/threonine protein kinase
VSAIAGRYQPLDAARPGTPQRARDLQTAQTVLLRDMRLPRDGGDVALARAQAAKGIFHPSLITLFDVVPLPENRVLLAYEFVPSQTIAQVSGGHPFNARRAAEIVTEIADAVAELHARGLAHGGISQTTVLITMKGKAKLDRIGDPSLHVMVDPTVEGDLTSLGDLLRDLVGKPSAGGITGMQAIEALVERARAGKFESAATFAAMLRRVGD